MSQIQTWQDYSFIIPGKVILTPTQLAAMNQQVTTSESAYGGWFLRRGGVIANRGIIGITVRGNASGPVTITDMEIVKHCGPPLVNATLFYSPTTGAGPFGASQIGFDLDQPVTIGQYIPAPGPHALSAGGNFFAKEVITLKPGEPRNLSAFATVIQLNHRHRDKQGLEHAVIGVCGCPACPDALRRSAMDVIPMHVACVTWA